MKEMDEEQWDNHARNLQAKMVEFSVKRHLVVSWMEDWLSTFSEAGKNLRDLRDLASILLEYQNQNRIPNSDMGELIDWLCDEAMLFNIEESQRKNK
jgi:hypothetical protein